MKGYLGHLGREGVVREGNRRISRDFDLLILERFSVF